jgi:hypothetical protein
MYPDSFCHVITLEKSVHHGQGLIDFGLDSVVHRFPRYLLHGVTSFRVLDQRAKTAFPFAAL